MDFTIANLKIISISQSNVILAFIWGIDYITKVSDMVFPEFLDGTFWDYFPENYDRYRRPHLALPRV